VITAVQTNGNCIHIQSFRVNSLFVHAVVTFPGGPTDEARLVFSFRTSISPSGRDWPVFQRQLRANCHMSLEKVHREHVCYCVLSGIKLRMLPRPANFEELVPKHESFRPKPRESRTSAEHQHKSSSLDLGTIVLPSDRWKADVAPEDEPPIPEGLKEDDSPFWYKCLVEPYQSLLRNKKIQVIVVHKSENDGVVHRALHGRVEPMPTVEEFGDNGKIVRVSSANRCPRPGEWVPTFSSRCAHNLPDNNFTNPSWTSVHTSLFNGMFLTADYKSVRKEVKVVQEGFDMHGLTSPCDGLSTHSSGGAEQLIGQRAKNLATLVEGKCPASCVAAKAQDPHSPLNQTLSGWLFRKGFVPVFVPRLIPGKPAMWKGSTAVAMQFMGHMHPKKSIIKALDKEEFNEFVADLPKSSRGNATFLAESHVCIRMEPLPNAAYEKDNEEGWQTIVVDANDQKAHCIGVVLKPGKTHFDSKRSLGEEFLKTQAWKPCLVDSVNTDPPQPKLPEKLRVTLPEALIALMHIQVGFAYRLTRRNVVSEEKGTITYLPWRDPVVGKLRMCVCTTASPSCIRTYDHVPSTLSLLSEHALYFQKGQQYPGRRIEMSDVGRYSFCCHVLTAIIARTTGRMERLCSFLLFKKKHELESAERDPGESRTSSTSAAFRVTATDEDQLAEESQRVDEHPKESEDSSGTTEQIEAEPESAESAYQLLSPDDIELLVSCVEASGRKADGTWKTMAHLVADIHKAVLPSCVKLTIVEFVNCLRHLKDNVEILADAMFDAQSAREKMDTPIGDEMISLISDFFNEIVSDKDTRGTEFLASQVAYDLNEPINLFHEEDAKNNEDVPRLILGHGGVQGASVLTDGLWDSVLDFLDDKDIQLDVLRGLERSGANEEDCLEMESIMKTTANAQSDVGGSAGDEPCTSWGRKRPPASEPDEVPPASKKRTASRSKQWLGFMGMLLARIRTAKKELLSIFGLVREQSQKVVVAHNKRLLSLIDIEHMCCKLHLALSRSHGTRACNKPAPSRTHCPPTRSKDMVPQSMTEMMEECIRTFEDMVCDNKWPLLPRKLWMAGEDHGENSVGRNDGDPNQNDRIDRETCSAEGDGSSASEQVSAHDVESCIV